MSKPSEDKLTEVPLEVLTKILTSSELRMIKNRWEILNLLLDGLSIRKVAQHAHVGTDTVMRTSRMLENEELRKVIVSIRTGTTQRNPSNPWIIGSSRGDE